MNHYEVESIISRQMPHPLDYIDDLLEYITQPKHEDMGILDVDILYSYDKYEIDMVTIRVTYLDEDTEKPKQHDVHLFTYYCDSEEKWMVVEG